MHATKRISGRPWGTDHACSRDWPGGDETILWGGITGPRDIRLENTTKRKNPISEIKQ